MKVSKSVQKLEQTGDFIFPNQVKHKCCDFWGRADAG
jgi:hypothetical protein